MGFRLPRRRLFTIALGSIVLSLVVAACGEDTPSRFLTSIAPTPGATPVPISAPSPTPAHTPTPGPTPTTARVLKISVNGDALEYDTGTFEVAAGAEVSLVLTNASGVNQHNWVLVRAGTKDDVATRGIAAGADNDWVQPADPDAIAHTKLLDPGETGEVRFPAPAPGVYQFVCTFPGHNLTMFGEFAVTAQDTGSYSEAEY